MPERRRRGPVAVLAAAVAMAVVALSLGFGGTPVGVGDNGDGPRLYCGAGLVPRFATVGSGATWPLTRLGLLYALAVGVLTGLAAWAVGAGVRLLALLPALVPLVGPTFTRFFISTFSEPAGLLGGYALCLGAAVIAVTEWPGPRSSGTGGGDG